VNFHVLAERIAHGPFFYIVLREERLTVNAGHIDHQVRLLQSVAVQSFGKLPVNRNAALPQDGDRRLVNKAQRRNSRAFRGDDVRAGVPRNRFRHLAADAIAHAHKEYFHQ
jgi:hypothetical protein